MSLLKLIKTQLGISTTPANNFTLDASADNGTMKLARGNAGATTQDILTVDASGIVSLTQGNSGILPSQLGNNGKVLTTDGATAGWVSVSGTMTTGEYTTGALSINTTYNVTIPTTARVTGLYLECISADATFAAGDMVPIGTFIPDNVRWPTTTVSSGLVQFVTNGSAIAVRNKTSAASWTVITMSSWRFRVIVNK